MFLKVVTSILKKVKTPRINPNLIPILNQVRIMSENVNVSEPKWKQEKMRYLNMDISEKRNEYPKPQYITIKQIETWPQFIKNNPGKYENLPKRSTSEIDESLNEIVAEKISIFKGDITTLEIDAIVNAANESLLGGGGVDGAIHKAAGYFLKEENKTHNRCRVGEAKISGGYKLPAKYVISTVGPKGEKPKDLALCYKNSLMMLKNNSLKSIAFPCISTGVYGYPNEAAAHVAIYEVRKFLENNHENVDRVIFCLFLDLDDSIYKGMLQSYFPVV